MSGDRDRVLLNLTEGQLLEKYRETIEASARTLLERAPTYIDLEDLIQAASLELLKAFRRARVSHRDGGVNEYLRTRIWGSLLDELYRTREIVRGTFLETGVSSAVLEDLVPSIEPVAWTRRVRNGRTPPTVDDGTDQAALVEAQQLWDLVAQAIDHLPPAERSVLQLYYLRGATLLEVGTILGVTESRASQIHHSALARLKTRMRRFAA